jgi:prophage regulatory protein
MAPAAVSNVIFSLTGFCHHQPSRSCNPARAVFISEELILKTPVAANDNNKPVRMKLLKFDELESTRGISYTRRHLYTLESERKFPKRVVLGENRVGWIESEIDNWLAEKASCRAA